MQLTIPENISARLRQLAARRQQSVETIIEDRLFTALDDELDNLPTEEQAELRALHHLSNDALRAIGQHQISKAISKWEPRILLQNVRITQLEGIVTIEVQYVERQTQQFQTLAVPVSLGIV